jgi:hypothetical protein
VSDIFDGGGVGATAPSEQFGGLLSQPPLSPAVERPAPLPTVSEPEPAPAPAPAAPEPVAVEPVAAEPDPNAPGMLERKLLQYGLVTMDQLGEAMREEAATGRPVADILIDRGWVTQEQIAQLFAPAAPLAAAPEPAAATAPAPVAELPPEPAPEPSFLDELPADPVPTAAPAPAPSAPPAPEPAAEIRPPEPVHAAPDPAPNAKPESPSSLAFHLYIRLSTGERIDANVFNDLNDARAHAEDLVKKLSSNSHVWPHFGGRYIRPEAIISIDVEAAPV